MKRGLFTLALLVLIAALVAGMTGCTKQKPPLPGVEDREAGTPVVGPVETATPSPPVTKIVAEDTPALEPLEPGLPTLTPTPEAGGEATPTIPLAGTPSPTPTSATTAIATAIVPAPTPTIGPEPEGTYYTVQRGDSLYSIAYRFNTTVDVIMEANDITDPHYIRVGQKLIIPEAGETPPSPGGERVHIVQPGENLFRIALRYGVSIEDIVRANNIVNPRYIYVGQRLIIP